jgi:hypothetical protein
MDQNKPFDFEVFPAPEGSETPGYVARTPYRQVFYCGDTEHEAIGHMLRGVAQLAREGYLNPNDPESKGVPPLQHVLSLLTEFLVKNVAQRQEIIETARWVTETTPRTTEYVESKGYDPSIPVEDNRKNLTNPDFLRLNEIISGISTAIAALARVKEL